jgi:hypothetical protein
VDILVTKSYYAVFSRRELREKHGQFSPVARMLKEDEDDA